MCDRSNRKVDELHWDLLFADLPGPERVATPVLVVGAQLVRLKISFFHSRSRQRPAPLGDGPDREVLAQVIGAIQLHRPPSRV
jgi:hypothetical protein